MPSFSRRATVRIYLAGVRDPRAKRVCAELGVRNYLLSFANQRAFGQNSDVLENPECRVMVDSGAFSVWNTGRKIDVKKYADFAHKLMARARCELIFVNLDVIPGRKNAPASSYELAISSEHNLVLVRKSMRTFRNNFGTIRADQQGKPGNHAGTESKANQQDNRFSLNS